MRALSVLAASFAVMLSACASSPPPSNASETSQSEYIDTYSRDEIVEATADFFGVTAEAAASALERVFADLGRPNGYIAGEEVSGAIGVGLRYGEGYMSIKGQSEPLKVYWQGPSIGFDTGGNASRVFTLVYNIRDGERIYQRFPGVEGSAYFVAGLGVNYQRAGNITLAPVRSGVGLRAGANVGYLSYSRRRNWVPF